MEPLSAVAKAAWLTDPVFVTLAKSLYGNDVDLSTIQQDVFGKDAPDQADVHVREPLRSKKKRKGTEDVMINDPAEVGKYIADKVAKGEMTNAEAMEEVLKLARGTKRALARGALIGAGAGLVTAGPAGAAGSAAVGAGIGAGIHAASVHAHKNQIKSHIASRHSGSYAKCKSCAVERESSVAKDWKEYDSKRDMNKDVMHQFVNNPKKFLKDPEVTSRRHKAAAGYVGYAGLGTAGSIGIANGMGRHQDAKYQEHRAKVASHEAEHHVGMARDAEALGHGEEAIRRHMTQGKKAWDTAHEASHEAGEAARASLRSGRLGVAGVAAGVGSAAYMIHQSNKTRERYREIAQVKMKPKETASKALDEHEVTWEGELPFGKGFKGEAAGSVEHLVEGHGIARVHVDVHATNPHTGQMYKRYPGAGGVRSAKDPNQFVHDLHARLHTEGNADHSHDGELPFGKGHEVTWEGEFSKVDEDKRQVFGWASVTEIDGKPVVDLQGDYIHPTEMERAAYDYVLKSRKGGDMHARVDEHGNLISKGVDQPLHVSDMIESMVFTPEKVAKLGLPEGSLPTGWWVGFKVNDEPTWNLVKSGGRKGFSIHGMGSRLEKRLEEIDPRSEIVGKAYEVSANTDEFKANLGTIADVTGDEFYKHLAHGINAPQADGTTTRNEVVGASLGTAIGSHVGSLAGIASGKEEGRNVGMGVGALAGAATGAVAGHYASKRPPRPAIVEQQVPRTGKVAMRYDVNKAVSTAMRSGSVAHRQNAYTEQAMQQATAALAPQVAQHIQTMQQQKWQQAQMEQQMLMQQANGQQPQNWMTQGQQQQAAPTPQTAAPMGPYDQQSDLSNNGVTPTQGAQRTL